MRASIPLCSLLRSTILVLSIASVPLAAETIYRWQDDRGNLVVSDRPPEDGTVAYETVRIGRSAMASAFRNPAESEPASGPETDAPVGAGDRGSRAAPGGGEPEKDPEACRTARENLKTLETFARIRTKDENGEYYYLTEEEKELRREQAREAIRVFCE